MRIRETGSRGNRHYNARQPEGPRCVCGALFAPACTNPRCDAYREPRRKKGGPTWATT